jgi:hypothetical protein
VPDEEIAHAAGISGYFFRLSMTQQSSMPGGSAEPGHSKRVAFSGRLSLTLVLGIAGGAALLSGCSTTASPAACASTQLTPTLTGLGGAASQSIWQLTLKNRSHSTCLLEGFLDVHVQDQQHQNIWTATPVNPGDERLIRVRPGMTVYTKMYFPYYDTQTGKQCEPTASWLRVSVPDDKGTFDVNVGPTPGPGGGAITFSPCGGLAIDPIQTEPVGP